LTVSILKYNSTFKGDRRGFFPDEVIRSPLVKTARSLPRALSKRHGLLEAGKGDSERRRWGCLTCEDSGLLFVLLKTKIEMLDNSV
jgi:hypothetical protein